MKGASPRITPGTMPKYRQLLMILRNEILGGTILPGERIPSEEDLISAYGLSRGTVRKAIAQLEAEKLIETEHGVGSFVRKLHPNAIPFHFVPPAAGSAVLAGMPGDGPVALSGYEVLAQESVSAPLDIAEKLRLPPGAIVLHVVRRRRADGIAVSYSERYLDRAVLPRLATEDLTGIGSIHDLLVGGSAFPLLKAEIEIEAHLLNEEEARLLERDPGEPAIVVHRMTYTAPNRPAVWYYGLFRSRYDLGVGIL